MGIEKPSWESLNKVCMYVCIGALCEIAGEQPTYGTHQTITRRSFNPLV
jgi:hypothetical protein